LSLPSGNSNNGIITDRNCQSRSNILIYR